MRITYHFGGRSLSREMVDGPAPALMSPSASSPSWVYASYCEWLIERFGRAEESRYEKKSNVRERVVGAVFKLAIVTA